MDEQDDRVQPIDRVLVANRGEIAVRIIATCQSLGIETVAVFTDADPGAPHVVAADLAVHLPGASLADTLLDVDAVVAAGVAAGVDALHPGYGLLSEDAALARACATAGLAFIGPSPEAIAAMGDKVVAREVLRRAGVPVVPGATLPGPAGDEHDLDAAAAQIGFPLLVKAAHGGGGRGMRRVDDPSGLVEAIASARREAGAAFGDDTVFLERFVTRPRHVEVQVVGDRHGNVVALFERDCSVQRRWQKVIEEAPSPVVGPALRAALSGAAVAAARAVDYVGAGTVEFVVGSDGDFHFLEMNTRLQVEHPVTEEVTGLDLVAVQVAVAEGRPLPDEVLALAGDEATTHGHDSGDGSAAPDDGAARGEAGSSGGAVSHGIAGPEGHAIEARLYAEDPVEGFLPTSGTIAHLVVPAGVGIRCDMGVVAGSTVSTTFDGMLGKVIAHGPSRRVARRRLVRALHDLRIDGVTTNVALLVAVLEHPEFVAGSVDTGWLDRRDVAALVAVDPATVRAHAVAAALVAQQARRATATVMPTVSSGYRNVVSDLQRVAFSHGDTTVEVGYRLTRDGAVVEVDGEPVPVVAWSLTPTMADLSIDGIRTTFEVTRVDAATTSADRSHHVHGPLGATTLAEVVRLPDPAIRQVAGSLTAPMPGSILAVHVAAGEHVTTGQPLVVLEAMKMEHAITAPTNGTVTHLGISTDDQVAAGQVLLVVDAD